MKGRGLCCKPRCFFAPLPCGGSYKSVSVSPAEGKAMSVFEEGHVLNLRKTRTDVSCTTLDVTDCKIKDKPRGVHIYA